MLCVDYVESNSWTEDIPLFREVMNQIATNHFRSGTLLPSNRVSFFTLKYFRVFLHRYLLFLHFQTFEVGSKGLTRLPAHLSRSKKSIHDCSSGNVSIKSGRDLNSLKNIAIS